MGTALEFVRVSKTFPGTRALSEVSFAVRPGSFHALAGGNGSGKSTLIKILAGVYQADPEGEVRCGGSASAADSVTPSWSHRAGVRFVHQDLGLFDTMTVAENLFVGRRYPRTAGAIAWTAMRRAAQECLDRLRVPVDARTPVGSLRPADQTLVAIARCLFDSAGGEVSLLVLDEPTARLPQAEVDELLSRLDEYAANGQSILYVSHRLDEILEHADTVTVLRDGRHVATRPVAGLDRAQLTGLIVGQQRDLVEKREPRPIAPEVAVTVRGLSGGPLRGIDLDVRRGEILAVAGLVGSGRTSLVETIFGVHRPAGGRVEVNGRRLRPGSVPDAVAAGLAYVPEDRARHAAFTNLGLEMNLSAASLRRYRRGWLRRGPELRDAAEDIRRYSIRAPGPRAALGQLSGGNQQKAILARWLRTRPAVLLLDEPTQGVDVGARAEIYTQIEKAVDGGTSVLLVTSDLDELLHLADRVVVLANGRVTDTARQRDVTREWVATRMFDAPQEIP
ncbi:sugar ABC transporter ATP-binding protein [Phytohabitans sp. ZYX-F-186]|uniref:Sugar ABC transporter ATP-binding protein n=1 Tax=Phytohabitans maris TaxID=3071409 RepID=A0ABU0ZH71_9ACTN|nr:sugar ABC transporter ATP-binding protein [Phytohabitans sp. ZYX-F-186]MDQ7905754.1 sugar ABC transporter ATP-binding protein [Phytohabitans sp. ZYX-F-186]